MEVTGRTTRDDGIRSKKRTNVVIYCDPCENEGEEQQAEGFCVDCQEYLCSSCFKIHRRPAVWRHHVLKDKESMPKSKTLREQLNYECTEPCAEHPSKILEYFCQTHAQLGCPICITKNHRSCNDVDYIPDIADTFREGSEVNEVFDTLKRLKERVETFSAKVSNNKIKVKTYANDAKAQILQLRDEFNSICDRLVDNVEDVSQCDESEIEGSLGTCEELLKKLRLRESVLEKKQAEMKLSQLFTEAKLSKVSAKEYDRELEMVKEHTKARYYEIKFDAEALREKFKLTFLDPPIEDDTHKLESQQTKEVKRGYVRNTGDADNVKTNVLANWIDKEKQAADRSMPKKSVGDRSMTKKNVGKIQYDREFILQFRFCSYALQKPNNLPNIPDIILQRHVIIGSADRVEDCSICMNEIIEPKRLNCGHTFCTSCIVQRLNFEQKCPTCGHICGKKTGDQPDGSMDVSVNSSLHLAGYENYATIVITYNIKGGTQGKDHPNPGRLYKGVYRRAYLPDDPEGRKIAKMLIVAFKRRLVFTLGNLRTTGQEDFLTWNGIPHKTDLNPNTPFGYPDSSYMNWVIDELAAKGVTERDISDVTL